MDHQERRIRVNYVLKLLLGIIWLIPVGAASQTPGLTATSSELSIEPNDTVRVTVSVDTAVDAYYIGLEAVFDPEVFEFVSASGVGIMADGIHVADLLNENRVGASVSLTSPLGTASTGDLIMLAFRVKQTAAVGTSQISFENVEFTDSEGLMIDVTNPEALEINIEEAISDLRLQMPEDSSITEGEELKVAGSIFVNDVTKDENLESDRLTVWVGINDVDTNPSNWAETAWSKMVFDGAQNTYHQYTANIGFGMQPGRYYIALRGKLDSKSYVYGGRSNSGGGMWDGSTNLNSALTISERALFRHTLAGWDFDDETLVASKSVPANDSVAFKLEGASNDGFSSNGASGMAANADGWQYTEGDQKFWQAKVSTEGFQNVTVSSKQYSTSAGPRDFELEASTDGSTWEVVSADTITLASDWSSGAIDDLNLPAKYDDEPVIYLRWIRLGDFRVDGDKGISTGNNRMDDVYIRGENLNAQDVTVWPGDCDDNGVVDELDVLKIGQYWLAEGPTPVYNSTSWGQRQVESWIPTEAAFADANGDGIVSHKDLKPLGLHFGNTTSSPKKVDRRKPLTELDLPALEAGESVSVAVKTNETVALTGLSVRFRLSGVGGYKWDMAKITHAAWGNYWDEQNRLLRFKRKQNGAKRALATWVHKGEGKPATTDSLAVIEIEATDNWDQQPRLLLERLILTENEKNTTIGSENAMLVTEAEVSESPSEGEADIPQHLRLHQNYPNPFNPSTVISYALPEDGEISIILYDLLGREVATIFEGVQQAGSYSFRYRPVGLSSGVYIYQLKTEENIKTRKFTYIK